MRLAHSLVLWLWVAFFICWLVLAQFNKKASPGAPWRMALGVRLTVVLVAVLLVLTSRRQAPDFFASIGGVLAMHAGVAGQWLGVGLCLAGFAFAVWARLHLGRNWGMPMSRKEEPELVTGGPYAFVRHPIYTGIILAILGSAIGESLVWAVMLIVFAPYFVYSARREEELMCEQFPTQYPDYMRRTKMIVPFVL